MRRVRTVCIARRESFESLLDDCTIAHSAGQLQDRM